jgi:2-keto-4-pentenoate hydratase/2-oxohepta-3-ene-1,7-dioic acid hydratase in catechol pathway
MDHSDGLAFQARYDKAVKRHVRYSTDPAAPPNSPDGQHGIHYGVLGSDVPEGAHILPPCWPSKIICVGRNYVEHARELGNEVPSEPLLFLKPPSSLTGNGDPIVYPKKSQNVHFEGELGVIIGKGGRWISREHAFEHILGYTCLNDVTARDIQRKDVQFTRGKGFDTFCAVGPWMVDRESVDLNTARIQTRVDGEVRQDAPLTDMIFGVDVILAYITEHMTLFPGDLIATGTPPGVGPVQPGSVVEIEITGIGTLRNPVVTE